MNKKHIRAKMLRKRNRMSEKERNQASVSICTKVTHIKDYIKADTVLFYYPLGNEVDITPLIKSAFKLKKACLPRIENGNGQMTARRIFSLEGLTDNKHNILEPDASCEIIEPFKIDFILVPLIAFDGSFHRIGFGGGYYDRYLVGRNNAYKCGVAYSFQQVGSIFSKEHDIKLDTVVTEI